MIRCTYAILIGFLKNKFLGLFLVLFLLTNLSLTNAKCLLEEENRVVTIESETLMTQESATIEGTLQRWHKITLTVNGPNTSETATPNPFMDYRFDATFSHSSGKTYVVPGYYSGCDDPTNGCNSGDKWKVHFTPDRPGVWNYTLSFKSGNNVAVSNDGTSAGFFDDESGSFDVVESNKFGRDFRSKEKGKLRYVGEHYLRFAGTGGDLANGNYFIKGGPDAPENTLAYNDFDGTPNRNNRRKNWNDHQQDYMASDASTYTWGNGKGTELLGVVNYLSGLEVNAFSFLTWSLAGDDENVFPHLMKVNESTYNGYDDARQWSEGVHHLRFDVSKLAQWERIFEYADKKGMFMHFKTMEYENCEIMDNGNFGNERKVYYRELIARFGHHLALNWNLSEESLIEDATVIQTLQYIHQIDAYNNHTVLHSLPNKKDETYDPVLGSKSLLTGLSLQTRDENYSEVKSDVQKWVRESANTGRKWVVALDEPGSAAKGIGKDDNGNDDKLVRDKVLWSTLLSGGMGVEYYYGYQTGATDLNAQSHRSREQKYKEVSYAISFFENYLLDKLVNMESTDNVTTDNNDHVFAETDNIYVIYRPNGGSTSINLPGSGWKVQWFNPRTGGSLAAVQNLNGNLVAPDNNDWVAVVTKDGITNVNVGNQKPNVSFEKPSPIDVFIENADLAVLVNATDSDGEVVSVSLYLNDELVREELGAPYEWGAENLNVTDNLLFGLSSGTYDLKAIAEDNKGATSQSVIRIEVREKGLLEFEPIHDAYLEGTTRFNNNDLRVENGNRVSYLMFPSPDLTFVSIKEARLELTVGSDEGAGEISVYRGNGDSWTETNLSPTNAPLKGIELDNKDESYSIGNTYSFDVSDYDFTGESIVFIVEQTASGNDVSFAAKENDSQTGPRLILKTDEITSIEDKNSESFFVFPNPSVSGQFNLNEASSWKVINIQGEVVAHGTGTQINISSTNHGVYILKVNDVSVKLIH